MLRFTLVFKGSVLHDGFHLLGLGNHLLDFLDSGDAVGEVLLGVHGLHLGVEVGGDAVAELLDGVHTGGLEQLGELAGDALDAEEVGMVGPLEDELLADARGLGGLLAAALGGALGQQVVRGLQTGGFQLGGVHVADAFDLFKLVCHNVLIVCAPTLGGDFRHSPL